MGTGRARALGRIREVGRDRDGHGRGHGAATVRDGRGHGWRRGAGERSQVRAKESVRQGVGGLGTIVASWGMSRERMLELGRACDREADGRFLVGVLSTGIYCLPSCPAKWPKEENVRFFEDEEAACRAGLRACLRCRPDDFYRGYDPERDLVERMTAAVAADPGRLPEPARPAPALRGRSHPAGGALPAPLPR